MFLILKLSNKNIVLKNVKKIYLLSFGFKTVKKNCSNELLALGFIKVAIVQNCVLEKVLEN